MRINALAPLAGALALVAAPLWADSLPQGDPAALGFSPDRLAAIDASLQARIDAGDFPGAVVMVAREGEIAHLSALGAQRDGGGEMTEDAIFRIYSMTKPVTSVVAMMLVEEGRLGLSDPISAYLPEYAEMQVLEDGGDAPVPAVRPIRVHDLLLHTAGMTYGFFGAGPAREAMIAANLESGGFDNREVARRIAGLPLEHQPGEVWEYSRSTDVLGALIEVIEGASLGEVFEARDDALERIVAVKVLTPAFAAAPSRIARFEREARILAALDHPNVATIHALGRSAGVPPHIVMERVEGTDVARALEGGAMGWRDALDVCEQIARALAAAHERGIVHRDLKPSNVMLRSDGVVKVLDFGLAERLDQRSRDGARPGQHVVGTPGYMSPEQARGEPADERSDVWSFGCILYECLTGSRLGGRGLAGRAGGGERAWSDEVPPPLTKLVERCLALDAAERPRDGAALVGAIQALRVGVSPQRGTLPPLPLRRTRFIGREAERRLVSDAVESGVLVTLVGPGGRRQEPPRPGGGGGEGARGLGRARVGRCGGRRALAPEGDR